MPADFRTSGPARGGGRRQILDTIRSAGAIARIDIAALTGVSPATVTALTSELMAAGLIQEVAPDDDATANPRGRPRVALKLRGPAHLVAGLKVAGGTTTVCILDFAGDAVGSYQTAFPARSMDADSMVGYLVETLEAACRANGLSSSDLSGIGLGIAGIVDAPRGFVYWSPTLSQRNIDLRAMVAEKLPMPIFIDNDANLVAKAEQLFGMGRGVSDFIVVTIEHGVGLGIVIDNQVYRGTRGCGAEFGHTKVRLDGALCRCGQRGCLEAYVADYALLREAGVNSSLTGSSPDPSGQLNALFAAAKAGDRTAVSIFQRAGRMFAMGMANLVNIFDPALIILSGERMQFDYLYADEVLDAIKNSVVQVDAPLPEVRIHKWGDLMWAKGAAAYAMEGVAKLALDRMASNAT